MIDHSCKLSGPQDQFVDRQTNFGRQAKQATFWTGCQRCGQVICLCIVRRHTFARLVGQKDICGTMWTLIVPVHNVDSNGCCRCRNEFGMVEDYVSQLGKDHNTIHLLQHRDVSPQYTIKRQRVFR